MEQYTKEMSEAIGVRQELLPYLSHLYQDFWVMGSSPAVIVDLLRPLASTLDSCKVLELGSGKGAVSVALAKELGFRVRGIDIFPPFVQEAQTHARSLGVESLCGFEVGDMRETVELERGYDVVVFAAVGWIWGSVGSCVIQLRRVVCSGGYIVIDDGYLAHTSKSSRSGWEHYRGHDKTVQQLVSAGDTVLCEVVVPQEDLRSYNHNVIEAISRRGDDLTREHPELKGPLEEYLRWEKDESQALETETVWAVWLLQRA